VPKPPHKTWTGKDRLDEETQRELRMKKLCYNFKESWELGHRCMGKGKFHYIEKDDDDDDDESIGKNNRKPSHLKATEHTPLQNSTKGVTISTLSGVPKYYTFTVIGILNGQRVISLIDGGATHNFIDVSLVIGRQIPVEDFEGFNVVVENGYNMACT